MIDTIYYNAVSITNLGEEIQTTASFQVPFLNFFMVFLVFIFTLGFLNFFYKIAYVPRKQPIEIKNKLSIAKQRIKNFFD
jgi:hypothetical protein